MISRALASIRGWLAIGAPFQGSTHRRPHRPPCLEILEDRLTPSAGLREQYMLELVNRMRANPAAELPILLNSGDADVNSALAYFHVDRTVLQTQWNTLTAAPPLAWNDILAQTALAHDSAMLAAGVQSHQVAGEAGLATRIPAAGYSNWSALGENIYAYANSIFSAHAAFAIDWGSTATGIQSPAGHRQNIMSTGFRDIGIGILDAPTNPSVGPILITQDFGSRFSYGNPYLVGVVFNDANANGYYDQGEGLANVTLTISGPGGTSTIVTTAYGGYQVQLSAGTYTVTATGGSLSAPVVQTVTIGANNVHVNFINGSSTTPPPPPQNATVPFLDDFNRANSSSLGVYWTPAQGSFNITNNVAVASAAMPSLVVLNGVTLANTAVQADINLGANQLAGLVARYQANGSYYLAQIYNLTTGRTAIIYKYVAGIGFTQLNKGFLAPSSGTGTVRFEVVGSSLKLFFGPDAAHLTLLAYAFDTAIGAAGTAGMRVSKNGTLDNFSADAVVAATPASAPFSDSFNASTSGQLSRSWTERQGNFKFNGTTLASNDPSLSLATVNGLALADVDVQANVAAGLNQVVGVIARYQANGNYYLAQVSVSSTGRTANIYKYVAGVGFTRLNTNMPVLGSAAGTLRFVVVGSTLKLYFGPDANHLSLIASATDASIAAPGLTGIRASKGATIGNFSIS